MSDAHTRTGIQRTVKTERRSCPLLRRFHYYRLSLALLLLGLFYSGVVDFVLGSYSPLLFALTNFAYLGFLIAGIGIYLSRAYSCEQQGYLAVFLDIPAITLLMHASGGISTGLGLLLTVSIAFGSLIMQGRAALAFASIASLALLTEEVYTHITATAAPLSYTQAGLLGLSLFAIAILSEVLARRLRESEQLADRRRLDLANLSQLNAYIVRHMQSGIVVIDAKGVVRLMNQTAWYMMGMPEDKSGDSVQRAAPALAALLLQWQQQPDEGTRLFQATPGGHQLIARITRLGDRREAGVLVVVEDATAITEQAQQMKLASLGRLTASIAHEIRNPLGAISHAAQLLQESEGLDPADRRLTEIIHNHSRRVNTIIEDVLNLSRRAQSQPDWIDMGQWLGRLATELREQLRLTEQGLRVEIEPARIEVLVDTGQLRQILDNLCGNAVRHFDRAPRELRLVLRAGVIPGFEAPFVEVIDNGPGIPSEHQRQIFEPFFTTRTGGTGLGLYISRELSDANHLHLEYLENPGGGSCFRIGFPANRTVTVDP